MWGGWKPVFALLGELSKTITSVGVLIAFFAGLIKPFRLRLIRWIKRQTNTDVIEEHLNNIDGNIEALSDKFETLQRDFGLHTEQTIMD